MRDILRSGSDRSWVRLTNILIVLALVGAVLFAKGFLQVRTLVEDKCEASKPPVEPRLKAGGGTSSGWLPVVRRRFIIVLIDALRIDFVLPSLDSADRSLAWYDKLNILHELATKYPGDADLFHFVADPPTATTQRLTALAAGTLPAFIQVAANFAEDSLGADNLIYQLLNDPRYQRLHLYGDDTWLSLFPIIREKSKGTIAGYHSFHLFDLDTVDNGIREHLYPALQRNDFDVIIAHFLGFDHCGHKYGPALGPCGDKLVEMDLALRRIIAMMDDDTQLIVMGDHGMTDNGDHGGISPKEVSSVLFSYRKSSRPGDAHPDALFWNAFSRRANGLRQKSLDIHEDEYFFTTNNVSSLRGSLTQIDFTPTFSLLAGIPIPFGNVGCVVPELLLNLDHYAPGADLVTGRIANLRVLVEAVRMNAWQLTRLIEKCQQLGEKGFEESQVGPLLRRLRAAEDRHLAGGGESDEALSEAFFSYYELTIETQQYFRRVWANFGMHSIVSGIAMGWIAVGLIGLMFMASRANLVMTLVPMALSVLHSLALSATSFVTFEDWMVRFMLTTMVLLRAISVWRQKELSPRELGLSVVLILLIRFSSLFGSCREEQFPFCQTWSHRTFPWSLTTSFLLVALAILLGMVAVMRRARGVLRNRSAKAWEHVLWGVLLSLLSLHLLHGWVADSTDGLAAQSGPVSVILDLWLPRMLFVACLLAMVYYKGEGKLLVLAVSCLTAIVLRPLAGFLQITVGFFMMDLGQELFGPDVGGSVLCACYHYLAGLHLFFISGHQMTLTNLQWEAAFVGLRSTIQIAAGTLMVLNTFSGPILATVSLLTLGGHRPRSPLVVFIWYSVMQLIASASFAAVLMHHLMVWKMFTPRFVLQALLTLQILLVAGVQGAHEYASSHLSHKQ